jgi:MraZ protein
MLSARVDEKGRLKLPVDLQEYVKKYGSEQTFITTLDLRMGSIYPISVWRENLKLLDSIHDDHEESAAQLAFLAREMGGDASLDGQGRVLLPQTMRTELKLEDTTVRLDVYKDVIRVYSEGVYEEERQRARTNLVDKLRALRMQGLK